MDDYLTPAVARAVEAVRQSARERGQADALAGELLLALIADDEGQAAGVFRRLALETSRLRDHLTVHPPVGQPVGELLHAARELARTVFLESTVASTALLLAMFRHDATLRDRLEPLGFELARFEQLVLPADPAHEMPLDFLDLPGLTETIDTARILDACANRAREALRVIEDYCRFARNDAYLCRELKALRHDLAQAMHQVPVPLLLHARETESDVGTIITTSSERERSSPAQVALVNLKRLQEALRSLEEYGKVYNADLGAALEQIRYRSYTLERALLLGADARQRLERTRLCVLLTAATCVTSLDFAIEQAAIGGADMIQLREKNIDDRTLLERARNVRRWTRQAGVLFLVNDRPDIARLVEADGVHLGQDDLPVHEARRIVGADALIGVSTHDIGQVHRAIRDGADYIGVGPVFPSTTKSFDQLAGLDFVRQVFEETTLPAFVIGGINLDTLPKAVAAGADRAAVSAIIAQADEPAPVAAALRRLLPE